MIRQKLLHRMKDVFGAISRMMTEVCGGTSRVCTMLPSYDDGGGWRSQSYDEAQLLIYFYIYFAMSTMITYLSSLLQCIGQNFLYEF